MKHKDKLSHEGLKLRKQKSLTEKQAGKYGVSTLLEDDSSNSGDEQE